MEQQFGFKELYSVFLKTTCSMEINGKLYEPGETFAAFDKIQLANFNEVRDMVAATGGYDNRAHVIWDDTKGVNLTFKQGIFSKSQLALLTNSRLKNLEEKPLALPIREEAESDGEGFIYLSKVPIIDNQRKIFVYGRYNLDKLSYEQIDEQTIQITSSYKDVYVDYNYIYSAATAELIVGQRGMESWVTLEGKTRFKDDITGAVKTGFICIPKMRITSDLVMTLGDGVTPVMGTFTATAVPTGKKGTKKVMEIFFLEDDIDSDIM